MAKLNLKSVYTNESTYTVLQLLYKMCDTLDTWDLNNIDFEDYTDPDSDNTYKLIKYNNTNVAVDFAKTTYSAQFAEASNTATKANMILPDRTYKCQWHHKKLSGAKAPVLNHPESELWIYLNDNFTDDSDPVRYWSFTIKIGNLTKYLSKNIASGEHKGKTGVIFRDSFQNLILEAVGSVVPSNFANSNIFVRASALALADTKLLQPTFMNDSASIAQIKGIGFDESFINYAAGGWSLNGDNNYVLPNTLIISGNAWCTNK